MTSLERALTAADDETMEIVRRMVGREKIALYIAREIAACVGIRLNQYEELRITGANDAIRRISENKRRVAKEARRIAQRLRNRIRAALKNRGKKSKRTVLLIGCSFPKLVIYLESQFEDGISWENYPEWHIDHIKPCSSFDLTDPKQQKLCFNYKNLQPLWAGDNFRKGAKHVAT